jgi:hypothetical protein
VSALAAASLLPLRAQQTANIIVKAGEVLSPVNRLVFGQNIEAGDNVHIHSSDTTDLGLIQTGSGSWDPAEGSSCSVRPEPEQGRRHERASLCERVSGTQL